jgi:hypothetical protein
VFVYDGQIKVINLITRSEHDIDSFSNLKGIDIHRESILVYCEKAPLLVSEFKNESAEIWRCYLDQDLLKEALLYCEDPKNKAEIASRLGDKYFSKGAKADEEESRVSGKLQRAPVNQTAENFEKAARYYVQSSTPFE